MTSEAPMHTCESREEAFQRINRETLELDERALVAQALIIASDKVVHGEWREAEMLIASAQALLSRRAKWVL